MNNLIRLQAIAKSFPASHLRRRLQRRDAGSTKLEVLRDVTLQVRAGEVMALVGSNGAGKTTLLEILATVQLPTSGSAIIGGYDLVRQSEHVRQIVGYCPANSNSFYPRLTGQANLEFFAALNGMSPNEARLRTRTVLGAIGGSDLRDVVFQRYSTGMKQKLALARALLADPLILLLDEPTRSLDPFAQGQFHDVLRRSVVGALNKTVLLVTHNLSEAETVADRVALLGRGTIAGVWSADKLPCELAASLQTPSTIEGMVEA